VWQTLLAEGDNSGQANVTIGCLELLSTFLEREFTSSAITEQDQLPDSMYSVATLCKCLSGS
jgi:hypothetical protein